MDYNLCCRKWAPMHCVKVNRKTVKTKYSILCDVTFMKLSLNYKTKLEVQLNSFAQKNKGHLI